MADDPYGGFSGTSWGGMSVEAIWNLLKDHDSSPHREMGDAWHKSNVLLENHVSQVRSYRDRLAEAWPPERSKASYAYLERLEQLIISLEETRLAASTNRRALVSAIDAVDESKEKLDRIQKEYADNQVKLQDFEKAKQETALATMDPLVTTPPVPYSRQVELEQQARNTMQSLSAELAAAQTTFIAPMPYSLRVGRDNNFESIDSGSGFPAATTITPAFSPRSLDKLTGISGSGAGKKSPGPGAGKVNPPRSTPSAEGPILGGTKTQPPPTVGQPTTITPPSTPNTTNPYTVTPGVPPTSTSPFPRTPTSNSTPLGTIPPTTGTRATTVPSSGIIGGPHSGLIGGSPSSRPGQLGAGTRGSMSQRVNPIGGMIGQEGGVRPSQRSSSRHDEESSRRWDPDNPWETTEGIDPVLLPSQEQRINPGPTIGGR